jgi:hypothetical protein
VAFGHRGSSHRRWLRRVADHSFRRGVRPKPEHQNGADCLPGCNTATDQTLGNRAPGPTNDRFPEDTFFQTVSQRVSRRRLIGPCPCWIRNGNLSSTPKGPSDLGCLCGGYCQCERLVLLLRAPRRFRRLDVSIRDFCPRGPLVLSKRQVLQGTLVVSAT